MGRINDLSGKVFDNLEVLRRDTDSEKGKPKWICRCKCGNIISAYGTNLTGGRTKSCGCAKIKGTQKRKDLKIAKGYCYNVWCPSRNNYKGVWSCTKCRHCRGRHTTRKAERKTLEIIA